MTSSGNKPAVGSGDFYAVCAEVIYNEDQLPATPATPASATTGNSEERSGNTGSQFG
jgi:hypothetical protein